MRTLFHIVVILLVLGFSGWSMMPYEQELAEDLHSLKLVPPRLSLEDRSRLKQKAFVATYGSLRPAIAAIMSVQTTTHHSNQDWEKLEEDFEEIVLLDPHNIYYWETASWHMALNAAADRIEDNSIPEIRRKKEFQKYIDKGREIYDQGLRINPKSWELLRYKARLLSNRHRNPDYKAAIATYREILALPDISANLRSSTEISILFMMLEIPELHQETYDYALELFNESERFRVPTVQNAVFIGQNHPLNKVSKKLTINDIYGSESNAFRLFRIKWKLRHLGQKPYGVESALRELEQKYKIPQNRRLFPN